MIPFKTPAFLMHIIKDAHIIMWDAGNQQSNRLINAGYFYKEKIENCVINTFVGSIIINILTLSARGMNSHVRHQNSASVLKLLIYARHGYDIHKEYTK